jgi:hypothetical protein
MLKKSSISAVKMLSDQWHINRLGKFTSSEIANLTYPSGFTEGSINYIRRKVGEELTGKSSRGEIETDATRWGAFYEAEAINKFGLQNNLEFIIVQQLVCEPDSRFGGTPDGLIVLRESPDKTEYEVETVEVKCPPTFDAYIGLFECETPADVKKENRIYYWQVLDQLLICEAKRGHFVIYHPDFKAGNYKAIIFNPTEPVMTDKGKTFPIYDDLKLLKARKQEALLMFDKIRSKLMATKAI